jgi:hypothetical protein
LGTRALLSPARVPAGCQGQEPHAKFGSFIQRSLREEDAMPETRHEAEAEKILATLSGSVPDEQSRRMLAEALETAERRGRQISGREKESSG